MATNNAFKITKDTSARKNTRVGSIQSAFEAAAMKESHDYYVNRLTEGYKQQLETMEQSYEDQIRELKSQMTVTTENAKAEAIKDADARAAFQIQEANNKLRTEQVLHRQTTADYEIALKVAKEAKKDKITLDTRYRAQIAEQSKRHNDELDKAHREKNIGPYRWTEIKFVKRYKSRVTTGAPKLAVKRSGAKFSELAQAALNSKSTDSWGFEYNGRPLTEMDKTLTQVSGHASAYRMAWICG
jgi:hypothetical protein